MYVREFSALSVQVMDGPTQTLVKWSQKIAEKDKKSQFLLSLVPAKMEILFFGKLAQVWSYSQIFQ